MPRPPPPAEALSIRGKPIVWAISSTWRSPFTGPSLPGTTGTPAFSINCRACALSPILRMASLLGPMKAIFRSAQISANCAFSARNP